MTNYTGIPVSELRQVLNKITPENFPFPDTDENALVYRRIWVFRIEYRTKLHFVWDDASHQAMLDDPEINECFKEKTFKTKNIKLLGEIELHWSRSKNDWIIETLIL